MHALTIRLPDPLYEDLRKEAFDTRTTINSVITEALEHRDDA